MKALMRTIASGKNKGKFKPVFYGVNGEKMTGGSDVYESEGELRTHLMANFPNFEIVDHTPGGDEEEDEEGEDVAVQPAGKEEADIRVESEEVVPQEEPVQQGKE